MKKLVRTLLVVAMVVFSVSTLTLTAFAASTPENAAPQAVVSDVSGSYHAPTIAKARETVTQRSFLAPTVYVDPVTHAVSNVYDANGNLIPATLSTDGHWYIVPTNEGYLLIASGM